MRTTLALAACALLHGCGGATPRSDVAPSAYEDGERVFAALRAEPVIFMAQHEGTEELLIELQSTLAAYGSRGEMALQAYQEVEEQPWRLRALIRAVEVYRFAAEVVGETRIMIPLDVRAEMEASPDDAEDLEDQFRGQVQSVLQQTAQRLRCRGRSLLQEMLPERGQGADAADVRRAREMLVELTGVCGAVSAAE